MPFSNEADVEIQFVLPLLRRLGWQDAEIHPRVPVDFRQGRKRGRKPEADFALAEPTPRPPKKAYLVVEVKGPKESMADAADQAFSYTYALASPYYLVTNGLGLELWLNKVWDSPANVLRFQVADLEGAYGDLVARISPSAVRELARSNGIERIEVQGFDLRPYLEALGKQVSRTKSVKRILHFGEREVTLESDTELPALPQCSYIRGLGGRGKTSVLRLVAECLLRSKARANRRFPILVRLTRDGGDLYQMIASSLGNFVPALASPDAVKSWMARTPTMLLLDDWGHLDQDERRRIEQDLEALNGDCQIVVTGPQGVRPPDVGGVQTGELKALTRKERDSLIAARMGLSQTSVVYGLLGQTHRPLVPLLNEPLVLDKYLELLQVRPNGGIQIPTNLADLLRMVIRDVYGPRLDDPGSQSADEIGAVCRVLIPAAHFSLEDVRNALAKIGSAKVASEFAEAMVSAGLWDRYDFGVYQFAHEVWRLFFFATNVVQQDNSAVIEWIREISRDEFESAAPILASLISDPVAQSRCLASVLDRSFSAYLVSLRARADAAGSDPERFLLEEFHNGYFDLVDRLVPSLKPMLSPWTYQEQYPVAKKPMTIGRLRAGAVDYAFEFVDASSPNVKCGAAAESYLTSETAHKFGFKNLTFMKHHNGLRPDSGRLLAAEDFFSELERVVESSSFEQALWFARERLLRWIPPAAEALGIATWETMPLEDIIVRLQEHSHGETVQEATLYSFEARTSGLGHGEGFIQIARIAVELERVARLAGISKDTFKTLALPQADLASPVAHGGVTLGAFYSPEQRRNRIAVQLSAVASTYRETCEKYFSPLAAEFKHYAEGPFRYVATITTREVPRLWDLQYYMEPCDSWDAPAMIELVEPGGAPDWSTDEALEGLWQKVGETSRQLGRPPPTAFSASLSGADWGGDTAPVSDMVRGLLKHDIVLLKENLSGAT